MDSNGKREYIPRCKICHKVMKNPQTFFEMDIVCPQCLDKFSDKELAVMTELFNDYGGWFGQDEKVEQQSFEKRVRTVLEKTKDKDIPIFKLNSLLIHWELIHIILDNYHLEEIKYYLKDH